MRSDKGRTHDKAENIGVDEGYKMLAAAIIIQAVDDYRECGNNEIVYKRGTWFYKSPIVGFFKGWWCKQIFETLTDYSVTYLTERLF